MRPTDACQQTRPLPAGTGHSQLEAKLRRPFHPLHVTKWPVLGKFLWCLVTQVWYLVLTPRYRSDTATPSSIHEYRIQLGTIGKVDTATGAKVTEQLVSWIPQLEARVADGTIKPLEYELVDGVGWDKVIEGISQLRQGKTNKKIVVRVQAE